MWIRPPQNQDKFILVRFSCFLFVYFVLNLVITLWTFCFVFSAGIKHEDFVMLTKCFITVLHSAAFLQNYFLYMCVMFVPLCGHKNAKGGCTWRCANVEVPDQCKMSSSPYCIFRGKVSHCTRSSSIPRLSCQWALGNPCVFTIHNCHYRWGHRCSRFSDRS